MMNENRLHLPKEEQSYLEYLERKADKQAAAFKEKSKQLENPDKFGLSKEDLEPMEYWKNALHNTTFDELRNAGLVLYSFDIDIVMGNSIKDRNDEISLDRAISVANKAIGFMEYSLAVKEGLILE